VCYDGLIRSKHEPDVTKANHRENLLSAIGLSSTPFLDTLS